MKNSSVKIIFHIDMNMFFCSVAVINNPRLKGKAFVVGRENSYKGVVSTASYEARKYGIHSGQPLIEAFKLLPNLIVVNPNFDEYKKYHDLFISLIRRYTNTIEVASIDEVYADMTEISYKRDPIMVAKEIQIALVKEYHLPSSIGIAPTLFLAKMASDIKKPLGITVLRIREIKDILYPLDVGDIYGVGKKSSEKLKLLGINKISDFMDLSNQQKVISVVGDKIYQALRKALEGHSSNVVDPKRYENSKSISTSITYDNFLYYEEDILIELKKMARKLYQELIDQNYFTKTVVITLRDSDFKTITRSKTIEYTNELYILLDVLEDLLEENFKEKEYRLLGVGFSNLIKASDIELEYNLFTWKSILEKEGNIKDIIKDYQEKYGKSFIRLGVEIKDK